VAWFVEIGQGIKKDKKTLAIKCSGLSYNLHSCREAIIKHMSRAILTSTDIKGLVHMIVKTKNSISLC